MTQGVNLTEEYFYVLAGTGTSGVLVGQALATKYDLLSHLVQTTRASIIATSPPPWPRR